MPVPLKLTDFTKAPILSGRNEQAGNLFSGGLEAFQKGQSHKQKNQADALKNALMEQYGEREKEADIGLKEAHAEFYKNPLQFATPFEKEAMGAFSDNPEMLQSILQKRAQQQASGPQNKLPAQLVGKILNSQVANKMRTTLLDEIKPQYIGEGSNKQLFNDVRRYKSTKDENEKNALAYKLASQVVSEKMVPELGLLTLVSNQTNPTVSAQKHQSKVIRFGWPEGMAWFENNLPPEIQRLADDMHAERVNSLNQIGGDFYKELTNNMGTGMFNGYNQEMTPQDEDHVPLGEPY